VIDVVVDRCVVEHDDRRALIGLLSHGIQELNDRRTLDRLLGGFMDQRIGAEIEPPMTERRQCGLGVLSITNEIRHGKNE